jgi:hypothetical protein
MTTIIFFYRYVIPKQINFKFIRETQDNIILNFAILMEPLYNHILKQLNFDVSINEG